jgi:hypothetical protein
MENNLKKRTVLVTVSDDRSGRKGGKYSETQDKIKELFLKSPDFGISEFFFWKWGDIKNTKFYEENKKMLDHIDPAMNGRCYKPFVILDALKSIGDGDFVIYNDTSPEWWENRKSIDTSLYDLEVIKNLCIKNNGILTSDVTWITNWGIGDHTHENFTLERCINKMEMQEYRYSLQHASGMIVLQKSERTLKFMEEWLRWNLVDECASLGSIDAEPVLPEKCICEYWHKEVDENGKIGHRHDQSISGLLLNKLNQKLVKNRGNYNFLEFCITGFNYEFIESNVGMSKYSYKTVFNGDSWEYSRTERI